MTERERIIAAIQHEIEFANAIDAEEIDNEVLADAILRALDAGRGVGGETLYRRCEACGGTGVADAAHTVACPTCRAEGYIPATGLGEGGPG